MINNSPFTSVIISKSVDSHSLFIITLMFIMNPLCLYIPIWITYECVIYHINVDRQIYDEKEGKRRMSLKRASNKILP